MSFLDEIDSLKSKVHLNEVNPFMLVGIILILLIVIAFALYSASSFFMEGISFDADSDALVIKADQSEHSDEESSSENKLSFVYVHVGGAVVNPGLFELPEGSRVHDAIEAAGGFGEDANVDSVNLAELLVDGQQVIVGSTQQSQSASEGPEQSFSTLNRGKVNINTASISELKTLDGVGDATAQKILEYRQTYGRFAKPEDLLKVSGIGEKKYEALKDKICV